MGDKAIQEEIERHVYAHDRVSFELLGEFLSEEQLRVLFIEMHNNLVKVLNDEGVLALEAVDRYLQRINERTLRELDEAKEQVRDSENRMGSYFSSRDGEFLPKPSDGEIEIVMNSFAEERKPLQDHIEKLRYTYGLAMTRSEMLRAVIHRFALFGDDSELTIPPMESWPESKRIKPPTQKQRDQALQIAAETRSLMKQRPEFREWKKTTYARHMGELLDVELSYVYEILKRTDLDMAADQYPAMIEKIASYGEASGEMHER